MNVKKYFLYALTTTILITPIVTICADNTATIATDIQSTTEIAQAEVEKDDQKTTHYRPSCASYTEAGAGLLFWHTVIDLIGNGIHSVIKHNESFNERYYGTKPTDFSGCLKFSAFTFAHMIHLTTLTAAALYFTKSIYSPDDDEDSKMWSALGLIITGGIMATKFQHAMGVI